MPATTPNLGIPYPLSTEVPAGHSQMQALASQVDTRLGPDTGWVSQTPVAGLVAQGVTGYRVIGRVAYWSLQVAKTSTPLSGSDIAPIVTQLPNAARPSVWNVEFPGMAQTGATTFAPFRLQITTSGVVTAYAVTVQANGLMRAFVAYPVA